MAENPKSTEGQSEDQPNVVSGLGPEWDWMQEKVAPAIPRRSSSQSQERVKSRAQTPRDVPEEPYDPFKYRDTSQGTGNAGAFMHLIKSAVGAGILSMPRAFKDAGLWFGLVGMAVLCSVCLHCCYFLVKVSRRQCVLSKKPVLDFGRTAEQTFLNGPKKVREHSKLAKFLVNFFICLTYFGLSSVYAVLIGNQTKQLMECTKVYETEVNVAIYILVYTPVLLLLGQFRKLKHIVPVSTCANICLLISFGIVYYYIFQGGMPPISERPFFGKLETFPSFISIAVFSMENIGVILPVENSLKHPNDYLGYGILVRAYVVIIVLYVTVGFFGYWKFGPDTADVITLNTPFGESISLALKSLITAAVIQSYALSFYIPTAIVMDILHGPISRKFGTQRQEAIECGVRIGLVLLTVVMAAVIPRISAIMGLVGAIGFSTTGILFPILFELFTFPVGPGFQEKLRLLKNYTLIFIYFVILILGTYTSIHDLLAFDPSSSLCPAE